MRGKLVESWGSAHHELALRRGSTYIHAAVLRIAFAEQSLPEQITGQGGTGVVACYYGMMTVAFIFGRRISRQHGKGLGVMTCKQQAATHRLTVPRCAKHGSL